MSPEAQFISEQEASALNVFLCPPEVRGEELNGRFDLPIIMNVARGHVLLPPAREPGTPPSRAGGRSGGAGPHASR